MIWGFPHVDSVECEHVERHGEPDGELHHQTGRAVLPDREDAFVRVGGQAGQVFPFLLCQKHHGPEQKT